MHLFCRADYWTKGTCDTIRVYFPFIIDRWTTQVAGGAIYIYPYRSHDGTFRAACDTVSDLWPMQHARWSCIHRPACRGLLSLHRALTGALIRKVAPTVLCLLLLLPSQLASSISASNNLAVASSYMGSCQPHASPSATLACIVVLLPVPLPEPETLSG